MEAFEYQLPTKIVFGVGRYAETGALCAAIGKKVLLHYGGGSIKKSGLYDRVKKSLADAGCSVCELGGVQPNPRLALVREGIALCKREGVEMILAVGGGSVMDCSKAISMAAVSEKDVWDEYWAKKGVVDFEPMPLGVIVTASGTGSECNGGAVITNEEVMIKTDRDYPKCNPEFALMDPTYTYTVPTKQMVAGSFDILSHVMETYFSEPDEDNVSDDISEALMRGVITSLRAALVNPEDYTARSNLMWLSTMAENRIIKLGKKCDFECHQMEHQISAYTNCSHGCGLAVLHPVYYRHICQAGAKKFTRFAENVWKIPRNGRTDEEMAEAGVEALADFIREIGLPTTLREVGVEKKEDLKEIADSCYLVDGSYKKMTHEEILEIFLECF